jgi:hypothetical protein
MLAVRLHVIYSYDLGADSSPEDFMTIKVWQEVTYYCSCPAVSQRLSFICFCSSSAAAPLLFPAADLDIDDGASAAVEEEKGRDLDVLECGGPTGTIREPNSTPMVTSW